MSTFVSRSQRSRPVVVAATIAVLAVGFSLPALAEEPKKIRRLGNPVTAFSTAPADTPESLRSQFETHRADIENALRQAGWEGNPEDLFRAVSTGEPQRVVLPPGGKLQWMAFRKNKQPVVTHDVVWAPKWAPKGQEQVFDAWQVQVESNCKVYEFLIPVVCLNLALYETAPVTAVPSCELSASVGAAECDQYGQISLSGSSDGSLEITDVRGGGMGGLSSAGGNSWIYAPDAAGSYEFTATATSACGMTSTCTASATVAPVDPCVKCAIAASYDADTRTITIADDGSVGTLDITGISRPDGTAGDMSKLIAAGGDRWTYTHKKRRKPGSYTWTFAARAERAGKTEDCEAAVTLDVPEPDSRWIFRAVGVRVDVDDSGNRSEILPGGSNLRDYFSVEPGGGFGLSIEHLYNNRLGVELGALLASFDSQLMRDIDDEWEISDENVDLTAFTLGANFHLTPGRAVDLYIGPFVGYVQLDDVTHRVLGSSVRIDGEDEFTWGAQIGIDVPASSRWAFTAGIKWLDLSYDFEEGDDEADELELGLDPLIYTVGVAYRF